MEYNYYNLFLLFFIYSFLGYIVESIPVSLMEEGTAFQDAMLSFNIWCKIPSILVFMLFFFAGGNFSVNWNCTLDPLG